MTQEDSLTKGRGLRLPGGRFLAFRQRPLVMGILNITPDSFSDGGLYHAVEAAVERGLEMLEEGADLLDLGAESTRPGGGVYGDGAHEVPEAEELQRLLPVLEALRSRVTAPLSVDTRKGEVARRALESGADLINDISMLSDPALCRAVADARCPVIIMHSRGQLATMQREIQFDDVVEEVRSELAAAAGRLLDLGVEEELIVLDPGIGFGKTAEQNLSLIKGLPRLANLGHPLLLGASRKSFMAATLEAAGIGSPPPTERLAGSLAVAAWAARARTEILRVHDVAATRQCLEIWRGLEEAA
ncbi:MAG: dihydropteroate synthase [Acidobacteriota bacterium]